MSDLLNDIQDAIHERESDTPGCMDWAVYIPGDRYGELEDILTSRSAQAVYKKGNAIYGRKVIPDPVIDSIQVLPTDILEMPHHTAVQTDPPEHLLTQLLSIDERRDGARNLTRYTDRIFFEVENTHTRLNHQKIKQYNFQNQVHETESDAEPENLQQVKFGYQITDEMMAFSEVSLSESEIERQFVDVIRNHIHSVRKRPIYATRERTITLPYPCLDVHHEERHRVGTVYTHYGGVYLQPIETPAKTIDFEESVGMGSL